MGQGTAPVSAGGAYSTPQTPWLDLRHLLLTGRRGGKERGKGGVSERGGMGPGEGEQWSPTHYFRLKSCIVGHIYGPPKNFGMAPPMVWRHLVVISWVLLGAQRTSVVWLLYFWVVKSYGGQITTNTASEELGCRHKYCDVITKA